MGAALTTQNDNSNLELRKKIDYIAKNLIFDSDFADMTKLGDEKYCNKLLKKVSDVFKKNKESIDIVLLRKKLYEMKKYKTPESNENELTANVKRNDIPREPPQRVEREQGEQEERGEQGEQGERGERGEQGEQGERGEQEQVTGGENRSTTRTRSRTRSPTTKKRMPSTPQNIHNVKKKIKSLHHWYHGLGRGSNIFNLIRIKYCGFHYTQIM